MSGIGRARIRSARRRWNRRAVHAAISAIDVLMSTDFDNSNLKWPDGVANSDLVEAREVLAGLAKSSTAVSRRVAGSEDQ